MKKEIKDKILRNVILIEHDKNSKYKSLYGEWFVIGSSVLGASHERSGKPNQDAIGWKPDTGVGNPLIIAISDGHGSEKSFRSDYGSKKAIEVALNVLNRTACKYNNNINFDEIEHYFKFDVPQQITDDWVDNINNHLNENGFTKEEEDTLREKGGDNAWEIVSQRKLIAYGATILVVVVTDQYYCCLQLGDGDILVVPENGNVFPPLQKDERLIANETTSLCLKNAARDFRVVFKKYDDTPPKLIMLSTDGYSNSFKDENGFFKAGIDFLALLSNHGAGVIKDNMEDWLSETSHLGSGDDVTLAIAYQENSI